MAKLIVEVVNRIGHVTERHRFEDFPIKVGRNYQNDLILPDVHISPNHLLIHESEQGWTVEDLDSHNGIQLKTHSTGTTPNHAASGDDIIIGKTRLRLFSPWHPVTTTHPLPLTDEIAQLFNRPYIALLILFVTLFVFIMDEANRKHPQGRIR